MNKIIQTFLLGILSFGSYAQIFRQPIAAIYVNLNCYSSIHGDAFSISSNQAALASLKKISTGVYGERRFMLADLSSYKLAAVLPVGENVFGFKTDYSGSAVYNQSELSLAYARPIGKMHAGIQFNYYTMNASLYGKASTINVEGGFIYQATEKIRTGIHIYNPLKRNMSKSAEELPFIYTTGIGYDVSDKFFMAAAVIKTENQPVNIQAGMQYCFDQKLIARMGASTGTTSFYFGAGLNMSAFRIDITASLHEYLGLTPGLMIIYTYNKK